MNASVALLTIFVLAVFVGFEVVSKVSSTLHTPLMSGANAIHGSSWSARSSWPAGRDDRRADCRAGRRGPRDGQLGRRIRCHRPDAGDVPGRGGAGRRRVIPVIGRRGCSATWSRPSASSSRSRGCRRRGPPAAGISSVLSEPSLLSLCVRGPPEVSTTWSGSSSRSLLGTAVGVLLARRVAMTAMPQLVALFNGVGGGAAALVAVLELSGLRNPRPRRASWRLRSRCSSARCRSPDRR